MKDYITLGAIILIIVLFAYYVIHTYNKLIKGRNRINTQWAQIDVQLTRRSDLIPNLVETVKSYASYEKELLEKISASKNALDSASSPGQAITANEKLSAQLPSLFALAEAYPELKADKSFLNLQAELKETENKIAYARQFYNDTVLIYKDKIQQFPSNIITKIFNFKDESYYIAVDEKKNDLEFNI